MSLDRRVCHLEAVRPEACPGCGMAPDERRPPAVVWPDGPDKGFEGDPHEACERCSRALYTVVQVVYESEEGGGASY